MPVIDIVVPALGESITEAIVARWLSNVGQSVAVSQPLVELETDKITVEVPAPSAGVLVEQLVEKALEAADRVYALAQGKMVLHAATDETGLPQKLERAYLGHAAAV